MLPRFVTACTPAHGSPPGGQPERPPVLMQAMMDQLSWFGAIHPFGEQSARARTDRHLGDVRQEPLRMANVSKNTKPWPGPLAVMTAVPSLLTVPSLILDHPAKGA